MPVAEFHKPANHRCQFQRANKGCVIHASSNYPHSCALWSCLWLVDDTTTTLARPDHAHYVIDPMPDFADIDVPDSPRQRVSVIQIWVDPKFPNAHRDPALREWLDDRARRFGQIALCRFDSEKAIALFPPSMCPDGQWHEKEGTGSRAHSAGEVLRAHAAMKRVG
jgi:hypothetical protein